MTIPIWDLLSKRKRKLVLWLAGLLAAYAVAGFFILPPIIRSVAVKQLSQQLGREVTIRQVRLDPFALSVAVDGLEIKDQDGQTFVSWDEVFVDFELRSLVSKAWTFKEISTSKPFVRARMNADGTFNFTDILNKFSTNTPAAAATGSPSKPLIVHVNRLHIGGAVAALSDYTTRETFKRTVGPLDLTLENFDTNPDSKNPYSFTGTTDAGEQIAWSGFFSLDPVRSQGELQLFNFTLNKYAALYQDLVRFQIRDGALGLKLKYRFELSATNRVAAVDDAAFALRDLKLGTAGNPSNLVEVAFAGASGARVDLQSRTAAIKSVVLAGARATLQRAKDNSINVVELARPAESATNVSGGVLFLLRSVTNVVALLLDSTNQWRGTVYDVAVTNCALHLEDRVNSRPAKLDLSDITFAAKNISNLPGTNLTAALSLRWNNEGSIQTKITASFQPATVDLRLDLDQLDLSSLDPYLEPMLDLFLLDSKVGLHGTVSLRSPENQLPQVTFRGDASLNQFHTVDGIWAEDLVKWGSISVQGIDANLNPPAVAVREIIVDGAYARLVVETNHTINLLNALRLTNTNAPATNEVNVAAVPKTDHTSLPNIAIGAIIITNTAVSFTDRSMAPNVNLSVQSVNGLVAGLSTEQLQHADVTLNALVDGVGPVNITGKFNPFGGTQTNALNILVKDVDLTAASPYAGKFAGYRITEGKLNLALDYQIIGTKLAAKNVITLDQFSFGEKVVSPEATHLPVRLAIAILKDRDGKIVLDVPIEGRLDDPKFRIGKVVTYAIVNILEKVATSPFSLLGAVFGGGGTELGYQDFAPGSAGLTAAARQKLDTLAKGLYARPGLRVELAGSIDPEADRDGLQRAAIDREIRTSKWLGLRKVEQATNAVDKLELTAADREALIERLYGEALASGKIAPQLLATNASLAAAFQAISTRATTPVKGASQLMRASQSSAVSTSSADSVPASKLVPPPSPMESLLLVTYPITAADLETLAVNRAKASRAYLLQNGQVEASRVFLKEGADETLRRDGSRAYVQFR